jgi:capsular polysaccharide biosynthesis protein
MRRVANRLRRHFIGDDSKRKSHHRLYISRRKAANRRIVNESEISPLLKEHGFEIVLCEDLSLGEQVRLFARTTATIGGHGAGLTNLIYCMPDSFVGEIGVEGVPPAYLVMSRQLGMRFSRFEANIVAVERSQVDMQVEPAPFREWICGCLDSLRRAASQRG